MHLRKAHYMFGWDWGAHLPDAGIFRPVRLLKVKHARIESVYIRQEHEEGKCTLHFSSEVCCQDRSKFHVKMQVSSPDRQVWQTMLSAEGRGSLVIENPQLWWVNGLGEQPLYKAKAVLFYGNQEVDTWQRRIGLRTMTMRREKDEWGESFAHEINGKAFFAMGPDYIPEENQTAFRGL